MSVYLLAHLTVRFKCKDNNTIMHQYIIFDRLAELSRLERLDISDNHFSQRGVPKAIYSLTNLKVLNIRGCKLSFIDDRLV